MNDLVVNANPFAHDGTDAGAGKVCVGYLSGVERGSDFSESLMNMRAADSEHRLGRLDHPNWRINQRSSVNVSWARNELVNRFLSMADPDPEWLLMVDADMVWQPGALESLLVAAGRLADEHDIAHPVVGGLCLAFGADPARPGENHLMATCYRQGRPIEGVGVVPFEQIPAVDVPVEALFEVYGTGAAFLLVHRQVLVDIAHGASQRSPWFRETVVPDTRPVEFNERNGYWLSEDLFFCLQAQRAGHRIFVHTGVEVQHVKPIRLTEALWRSGVEVDCA